MQVGPYWIEEEIGRGGAGVVARARGPQGEVVALKLLSGQGPEALARFQREIQHQAELTGEAGFVPIFDAGLGPRGAYLVMPYISGGTLRDRLRRAPAGLPLTDLLDLAEALATSIGRAHAIGLVHRDLKPENVLFDHNGCPLIADLGLAKAMEESRPGSDSGLSKTGELRGTLGYMPPEQIHNAKHATAAADVFALGAILYECATGTPAFHGQGALEVMDLIRNGKVTKPRRLRSDLPKTLSDLLLRCLEPNPDLRPANGTELAEELARVGLGAPSGAGSRRLVAWGSALCLGLLAAGVGHLVTREAQSSETPAPSTPLQVSTTSSPSPVPQASAPSEGSLPSQAPHPSPEPSTTSLPTPTPAATPPPSMVPSPPGKGAVWVRVKNRLAVELDELQSIEVVEQHGIGIHRGTSPIGGLFLVQDETKLMVWDQDSIFSFSFPDLRPLSAIRVALGTAADRASPSCVRLLGEDGRALVTSIGEHAYVNSGMGSGLKVKLEGPLEAAAILNDSSVAALVVGKRVALVSLESSKVVGTLLHKSPIVAIASGRAPGQILTALEKGEIHLWSIGDNAEQGNKHLGQIATIEGAKCLSLGPAGDRWAVASDKVVFVGSLKKTAPPLKIEFGEKEKGSPRSLRISKDGSSLFMFWPELVIQVSLKERKVTRRTEIPASLLNLADSSGDHILYVSASSPHLIRKFHIPTEEHFKTGTGHVGAVTAVAPAPNGVLGGDSAGGHSRWERGSVRYIRMTPGPITGIAQRGERILIARRGHPSTQVRFDSGQPTEHKGNATVLSRTTEGKVLLGHSSGTLLVLLPNNKAAKWSLHSRPIRGATRLPWGVLTWAEGESQLSFSLSGKVLHTIPVPEREVVAVAALRGQSLAVAVRGGKISVFKIDGGRLLTSIKGDPIEVSCLASHRSGRLLLAGGRSGKVTVYGWDPAKGVLTLREQVELKQSLDRLTFAGVGSNLDELYLGTGRGSIVIARWLPLEPPK